MIRAGYKLLGSADLLHRRAQKEVRAWTAAHRATAPQAAGTIHTDFERGFIRAEVIAYEDYRRAAAARAARRKPARCASKGSDYVVRDGDVMLFPLQRLSPSA